MDFKHWPETFEYHHPNPNDATPRSTDYAGSGWRSDASSAAPLLYDGSERYILKEVGVDGMHEKGASTMVSGARRLAEEAPASK